MIEGYPLTSIDRDIQTLCSHIEHFITAETAGNDKAAAAQLMYIGLWKNKIDDSFNQLRDLLVTEEGLPVGGICNASVQFSQLMRQFSDQSDAEPTAEESAEVLPQLRTFMCDRFSDILALEAAAQPLQAQVAVAA